MFVHPPQSILDNPPRAVPIRNTGSVTVDGRCYGGRDVHPHQKCTWFLPGTAYPVHRQMALESKPLFHPEVLRQQVRAFNLPEQTGAWQPKLQHWAGLVTSGRADQFKDVQYCQP